VNPPRGVVSLRAIIGSSPKMPPLEKQAATLEKVFEGLMKRMCRRQKA